MSLSKYLAKIKKSENKHNPMEDSEYCYYQSLGKALAGFAQALELRQGRLSAVTTNDILDYADIDRTEFEFLFGGPNGLVEEIHDEIRAIFSDAENMLAGMEAHLLLSSVLKRLKKKTPMLTVLRLLNDHVIWREVLKGVALLLSEKWPEADSASWDYLYHNFCCQFALVLEMWERCDFADNQIDHCVHLILIWVKVDTSLASITEKYRIGGTNK